MSKSIINNMCKKKNEDKKTVDSVTQRPEKCGTVKFAFILISIVFTFTIAFLVIWPLTHESKEVRDIQVSLRLPVDSLAVEKVLQENDGQIRKIVDELDKQSKEITDKYNVLLKAQETESDFFRLVSCIAAFVVALLGFLGYKTIKDIEAKAQSVAKDQADSTAEEYVSKHLEQEVERQLKDIVGDTTAAKLLKEQLLKQIIPQLITPLESRIAKIESEQITIEPEGIQDEEAPSDVFSHTDDAEIAKLTQEEGGECNE